MKSDEPSSFFPSFSWAVPLAFADALGACHFSRGDTLYSDPIAYRAWDDEFYRFGRDLYAIKVLHPEAKPSPPSPDLFRDNWDAPAEVEFHKVGKQSNMQRLSTTQGRIYSLLWRGDVAVLDIGTPMPQVPHQARYLLAHLKSAESSLRKYMFEQAPNTTNIFALPHDRCNSLLEGKYQKLAHGLCNTMRVREIEIPIPLLAIPEADHIAPTVSVKAFAFLDHDENSIRAKLKEFLYTQTTNRKANGAQFRLQAHGFFCTTSKKTG